MPGASRQSGFTLLEMLVALAALGLLAALLAGSVQFGARAWETQDRRLNAYVESDAVHNVVRDLLRGAEPLPLVGLGTRGASAYLLGGSNAVDFVSELPEAIGRNGYCDIALRVTDDGRLMLHWRRHVHDVRDAAAQPGGEVELLRHVAAIELTYFAVPSDGEPGGWRSTWVQPAAMPALIKLRLRFAPGDRRIWTDLLVAPIIGSSVG
jgi:general secretion pathway protein J